MSRFIPTTFVLVTVLLFSPGSGDAQDSAKAAGETVKVHLRVNAGTPLRLYLTKRARYAQGEMAEARFAEPVWAFDRIVIPAGTPVKGSVVDLQPVSKMVRAMSVVRGDFTPLKHASVSFTSLALPGAAPLSLDTQPSLGLATVYVPPKPGKYSQTQKAASAANRKSSRIKQFVKQQAQTQANTRSRGLLDFVRGPNKREWLENFLWSKLPYHPQWYRSGTRFDAILNQPLDFGEQELAASALQDIGSTPPPDSPALVRIVSTVSSADAKIGDPLEAVLARPLFNRQKRVVLPEGTRMSGKVTLTRHARMFHRGGQLRFAFNNIEPTQLASSVPVVNAEPTFAQLTAAESSTGSVKVDEEGTAKATESKTRFLRPAIAGIIAAKSLDNDEGRSGASGGGAGGNASGRGLGGFSGFGLLGTAASYGPKPIGAALGFYGLAWSVYSTIVARGTEVTFVKNSALAIRFGTTRK